MDRLTREQMYRWVWSRPVSQIGPMIGISGTAVAKICRKFDIPTPGRGYWRKLQQNKNVTQTPLPNPEENLRHISLNVSDEVLLQISSLQPFVLESTGYQVTQIDAPNSLPQELITTNRSDDEIRLTSIEQPTSQCTTEDLRYQLSGPNDLVELGKELADQRRALDFQCVLSEESRSCGAPIRAVVAVWLQVSSQVVEQNDPVQRVIKACASIADGKVSPPWWEKIQSDGASSRKQGKTA